MTFAAGPAPAPVPEPPTCRTVGAAWVRPRFAGYPEFQTEASVVLRDGLIGGENHGLLIDRVNELFALSSECIYPSRTGAYIRL